MVVTVPRMGNTCLAAKAFFEALHIPYVIPDKVSKKTMQNGAAVSPEEICLPFKICMGCYDECISKGADTILITGSCGPCRFGEYCELQMKLLKKLGHNVRTIVLDAPSVTGKDEFFKRIGALTMESRLNKAQKLLALRQALQILALADKVDAKAYNLAGYEVNKGECRQLLSACQTEAYRYSRPSDIKAVLMRYIKKLDAVQTDKNKKPLRLAIIGEIYSMIEPFANLHIEEKLMDYGVSTSRLITPSWWIHDLVAKPLKINSWTVNKAASRYLPVNAGGHARESIGHAVLSTRKAYDGVIQIFPLGCMPEIVVKAIMPRIQKEKDLPVLTLIIDEMTGEAGYITRIEAFLDMLNARKKKGAYA